DDDDDDDDDNYIPNDYDPEGLNEYEDSKDDEDSSDDDEYNEDDTNSDLEDENDDDLSESAIESLLGDINEIYVSKEWEVYKCARSTWYRMRKRAQELREAGEKNGSQLFDYGFKKSLADSIQEDEIYGIINYDYSEDREKGSKFKNYTVKQGLKKIVEYEVDLNDRNKAHLKEVDKKLTAIDKKKILAIHRMLHYISDGEYKSRKVRASLAVAQHLFNKTIKNDFNYQARLIRQWTYYFLRYGKIHQDRQGCHTKTNTIIYDEQNQLLMKTYLRSLSDEERTPQNFREHLNKELLRCVANAPTEIKSDRTAARWMRVLGFDRFKKRKGYFTDGHNRKDVVDDRQSRFLPTMKRFQRRMFSYEGTECQTCIVPELKAGEKRCVLITHDESTFYACDGKKHLWLEKGKGPQKPHCKHLGPSVMITGFCCSCHGFMQDPDNPDVKSYSLFEAGSNRDGYFTNDDLVKQLKDCYPLFKKLHPDCDILIAFDNATTHHGKAADGLDVTRLNLSDGGKQRTSVRDGWYVSKESGEKIAQKMIFSNG
ncbi:hypothetical protein EBS02_09335, partial [bacterium]|nr:hypothetical protein [bacterium]